MSQKPLVSCAYGWGRTFKLYQEYLDVDGTLHALKELRHVRSISRRVMNVPSVRLELRFREKDVVLRGIAAIEDADKVVEHLQLYCPAIDRISEQQYRSRTRKIHQYQPSIIPSEGYSEADPTLQLVERSSVPFDDRSMREHVQASTTPMQAPSWLLGLDQDLERVRKQRHAQEVRSLHGNSLDDIEKFAQKSQADTLPSVAVPLHLTTDEQARYSTDATLCGEPLGYALHSAYPPEDHGTLILTNKRLIYIGRKSQLVLSYAHLTHIARLRGALAFLADSWSKQKIFEVSRPLECALYLESLLRQFHQQSTINREQETMRELALRQRYATPSTLRTTRHTRAFQPTHNMGARPVKLPLALADVETLPLSSQGHAALESVEEAWISD